MRKVLIILLALLLTGCSNNTAPTPENNQDLTLELFIPKGTITYDGILDYMHSITPVSSDDINVSTFNGELEDLIGESLPFKVSYQIDQGILKELYYSVSGANLYFSSIIPEKHVLVLPLNVGSSWEQEFNYSGSPQKSKTTLIKIELSPAGKRLYTTETIVFGIKGFKDNRYYEKTVFEEGYGIVSFEKSLELTINEAGEYEDIGFDFSYTARGKYTQ